MIENILTRLRELTQLDVQAKWRVSESFSDDISTWPLAQLNEKNQIIWNKGSQICWFAQILRVPTQLQLYPLDSLSLRLKLTWWAENAQIYLNSHLVQEGDLFDSTTRILLSNSVSPGEEFTVFLRLVSPQHDQGGLLQSICFYEEDYSTILEPGFFADEMTILSNYLKQFYPLQLAQVEQYLSKINWEIITNRQGFINSLAMIREELKPLSYLLKECSLNLLGHAHLDLAWLWTVNETWQVAQRTFSSVLNLQKNYPELIFGHSTACLYQWLECNQIEQFKAIQAAVKAGNWEILGGMWVEPEVNLVQGESLVRQLLYGQKYLEDKFGLPAQVAWLPDSFGFTWQLPQIFKLSGIKYFVTGKLHWNDTNKFPHGVFNWQSPDGTEIVTLISPPNVAGVMDTNPIIMTEYSLQYLEQTGLKDAFWLPGVGDHGGGPTRDMLDIQRRWQKSAFFPQLKFTTALEYLEKIDSSSLPKWQDELYLEFHRGCYTTHADQKKYNRYCETLLYQAELWSSLVCLMGIDPQYPQLLLEEAWKKVLFNQFHDILPGTSITEVFTEANQMWLEVIETGETLLNNALKSLASSVIIPSAPDPDSQPILIFNSLNGLGSQLITLPQKEGNWTISNAGGESLPSQYSAEGDLLFLAENIPSIGYALYWLSPLKIPLPTMRGAKNLILSSILDNGLVRVTVNSKTGNLESIFDLVSQQEVLNGAGNELQAFQDEGQYWDAWNIDPKYQEYPLESTELKSIQYLEEGPLRWRIKVIRTFRKSIFEQDYCLVLGSAILTISTRVDWQEEHILIKASFPWNLTGDIVTYEIPCGSITRPASPQNPQEEAKWEVPALRWASITDPSLDYGVSLLNDSKYGYDTSPNRMRLTLLRGSRWPDPQADLGIHTFDYAIYPHQGNWKQAKTVQKGLEFNCPYLVLTDWLKRTKESRFLSPSESLLSWQGTHLILMSLKQSQEGSEWIIRLYEGEGKAAKLELESKANIRLSHSLDCLERPIEGSTEVKPWQIVNFSLKLA